MQETEDNGSATTVFVAETQASLFPGRLPKDDADNPNKGRWLSFYS